MPPTLRMFFYNAIRQIYCETKFLIGPVDTPPIQLDTTMLIAFAQKHPGCSHNNETL